MALNPQSQAVAQLNEINSLCVLLNQFLVRANTLQYLPNAATIWQALPTKALNADGSLGSSDTNPNNSHPIDPVAVQGLNRACSEQQYVAALTFIQELISSQATPENLIILAPFLGG